MRRVVVSRGIPLTAPVRPSRSRTSEAPHASSWASPLFQFSTSSTFTFPLARGSLPVAEAHRVARSRFRSIAGHVINLVILESGRVHGRNHRIPVLDFRRANLEVTLWKTGEHVLVAGLHSGNDLLVELF